MEHVSLGRKLPFALLNWDLWRCWRECCGCYYVGHLGDRDEGGGFDVVPLLRPTVAIIMAICVMQATPRLFPRCWARFFPDIVPVRFN